MVKFRAQSEYVSNDWRANPNGESCQSWLGQAHRSRVQDWIGRVLPTVDAIHKSFADKYGWDKQPATGLAKSGQRSGVAADAGERRGCSRPSRHPQAVSEVGIHYGAARVPVLSGSKYGSGIKGVEARRLNDPGVDPRIKRRVYFYLADGDALPRPEASLGVNVYRQPLTNLYDPATGLAAGRTANDGSSPRTGNTPPLGTR